MNRKQFQSAGRSDRGLVRAANEDCVAIMPDSGLVIVADGMGGANAGGIASHMAVEIIAASITSRLSSGLMKEDYDYQELILDAITEANGTIYQAAIENPEFSGMGTTVVVGLFRDDRLLYAHVGDSRLYRLRKETFERLTIDHSVIQTLVDQGMFDSLDKAEAAGVRNNVLTRALGIDETLSIDMAMTDLRATDVYLFCTDGLTNMVDDLRISSLITREPADLDVAADKLVEAACMSGGADNISLVLVRN